MEDLGPCEQPLLSRCKPKLKYAQAARDRDLCAMIKETPRIQGFLPFSAH
jgi:hypothetical protein